MRLGPLLWPMLPGCPHLRQNLWTSLYGPGFQLSLSLSFPWFQLQSAFDFLLLIPSWTFPNKSCQTMISIVSFFRFHLVRLLAETEGMIDQESNSSRSAQIPGVSSFIYSCCTSVSWFVKRQQYLHKLFSSAGSADGMTQLVWISQGQGYSWESFSLRTVQESKQSGQAKSEVSRGRPT